MGKSCPSFELLSAYRDGETTSAETAVVARHLPGCATCQATISGFDQLAADVFAAPLITCEVARPLLSAQIDGEASAPELAIVAQHLAGCVACEATRATWTGVEQLIASLPEAFPSPAADAKIRALAHRGRAGRPNFGRAFASLAVATATVALAVYSSIGGGLVRAPQLGAAPQGGQAIVASAAQQIYNPLSGLLYVLEPAPKAAIVVRDAGRQRDVKTIFLGGAPSFMAINATAKALYVVDPLARTYTSIDTDTNEVTDTVPLAVTGTPTSIAVDAQTGKLVVATEPAKASTTAATPAASTRPEISVIDPASKTLEIVKQVDVSPTRIVVDAIHGRLFLLGPASTTVLDARTYDRVDTIPGPAVGIAAGPQSTALLSERDGTAILTPYRGNGSGRFSGRPAGLFALPDGGFAVLVEDQSGGRIVLANADGSDRGITLNVPTVRGLSFDVVNARFIAASGDVVAAISQGVLVVATPSPAPSLAAAAANSPATAAPTDSQSPAPSASVPATATPLVTLPSPTPAPSLFPGAVLSAGLFRYEVPGVPAAVAIVRGDSGRLWYAGRDGTIRTIDPASGNVGLGARLGSDAQVTLLSYGSQRVFALDVQQGNLFTYDTVAQTVTTRGIPFGRSISAMDVAPDGTLWLATTAYNGLLSFEPRTGSFTLVPLPAGTTIRALSIDIAGRLWFYDDARSMLESYEPASGRRIEYAAPIPGGVRLIRADTKGGVWIATGGSLYRLANGAIALASVASGSVQDVVLAPDGGVIQLVNTGTATLFGRPGGAQTVASGRVGSLAVDGTGQVWLADSYNAIFYIAAAAR